MEYGFANDRLRGDCDDDKARRRKYGPDRAKKIAQRLAQLRTAETAADLKLMSGRFHALSGDRSGQFSLDLDGPYRMIMEPDKYDPDADGEIDLAAITGMVIVEIVDYH